MAAKTQAQDIAILIIGIDMSNAFDTIYRDEFQDSRGDSGSG